MIYLETLTREGITTRKCGWSLMLVICSIVKGGVWFCGDGFCPVSTTFQSWSWLCLGFAGALSAFEQTALGVRSRC